MLNKLSFFLVVCVGLSQVVWAQERQVYVAVDMSNSMNGLWPDRSKWEASQESLKEIAKKADRNLSIGLVFFGGTENDCDSARIAVPAKRHNRSRIRMGFKKQTPAGATAPLTGALKTLSRQLIRPNTQLEWIIVTDGGPYCDDQFPAKVKELKSLHPRLKVSVVGLNLTPEKAAELHVLAASTGGWSFNARNGEKLTQALLSLSHGATPAEETVSTKIAIKAPRKATLGDPLTVNLQGNLPEGTRLGIYPKNTQELFHVFDWAFVQPEQPITLIAPDIAGAYELRLISHDAQLMGVQKLKVKNAKATVSAPGSSKAAGSITVNWKGPAGSGDRLALYAMDSDAALVVQEPLSEAQFDMMMPSRSGIFALRYETGTTKQVLAETLITIEAPKVIVGSPRQVIAGSDFMVRWQGPAASGDILAIADAGTSGRRYRYQRVLETTGTTPMLAPDKVGSYKVQYISGKDQAVLSEVVFRTMPARAFVRAGKKAVAGTELEVNWSGPNGSGDLIGIYGLNQQGQMTLVSYAKVNKETPLTVLAPDFAGDYQIRYVTGQSKRILAEAPLEVTEVEGTVSTVKWIKSGQEFQVNYSGPRNKLDVIALLDYSNPKVPTRIAYKPVGPTNFVTFKAPAKPGVYEVRYLMGKSQRKLANAWVQVK